MFELSHMVWSEKYRPNRVEDCILPKTTKKMIQGFLKSGQLPNMILSGPAGTGKSTCALAICAELGYEVMMINGSNEGRLIDTLRTKIAQVSVDDGFNVTKKLRLQVFLNVAE